MDAGGGVEEHNLAGSIPLCSHGRHLDVCSWLVAVGVCRKYAHECNSLLHVLSQCYENLASVGYVSWLKTDNVWQNSGAAV